MEEYHIPYRIRNNVSLFESRIVKIILLPFLIQSRGYQSEEIVSYMELNGDNKIRDIYIKAKLDFFFTNSIETIKENWINGIDKYIEYLDKKLEIIKNSKDENDEFAKTDAEITEEYIKIVKSEKKKIEKVFEDLKEYEIANKDLEKFKEKLSERTDEIRKKIHIEDRDTEEEQRALGKFSKVAYQFIEMMENYGEFEGNLGNILKEICILETYIPTEFFNNTVEIFSLNDARYSEKEYLFVSGFINGEYPLSQNKILYDDDGYKKIFEIKDPYYKTYRQSKLHLYMSLAGTKKAFFTYFDEDTSGNSKTPSVFLDDFTDKSKEEIINDKRMIEIEKALSESHALSIAMINNKVIESLKDRIESISLSVKKLLNKKESIDLDYCNQSEKPFSFSQFQTYVECPYKYFIKYFLHFKQKEEISFGVSPLDEGNLMHEALRDFMKYVKEVHNGSITEDKKIECTNKLKEIIEEKFKKYVFVFNEKYMDFWKKKIFSYADKIIEKEIKESKKHRPDKLEQPFKNLKIGGIKFNGRIDRIDLAEPERKDIKTYVIDYKPSDPNVEHKKYQLYLYILSTEKDGYEQPIQTFFYIYKGKTNNKGEKKVSFIASIKYKDGIFNYDKKEDKQFKKERIEKVFRTFGNHIEDKLFNIKVFEANKKKDDVVFSMIKRSDGNHDNYCKYCPLKNFCNRGEI
jgi:ATP-dependent helicase/nuclease subunit B